MNWPLADIFMIEIDRWPRGVAPLASHIEDLQRKFEMRVLNRYVYLRYFKANLSAQNSHYYIQKKRQIVTA